MRFKLYIGIFFFEFELKFIGTGTDTGSKSPLLNLGNFCKTYQILLTKHVGELQLQNSTINSLHYCYYRTYRNIMHFFQSTCIRFFNIVIHKEHCLSQKD